MYTFNIELSIFITICVAVTVWVFALFLDIETYADKEHGRFRRIVIRIVSVAIIGTTGVLSYTSFARLDIVTNTLMAEHSNRPVRAEWNNDLGQATYLPTDTLGRPTGVGVRFNACTPIRTRQDESVTAIGLPHTDKWVSAPLISSQLWASTNASNIVPMTKETQTSLYDIIEYEALWKFERNTVTNGDVPLSPDACTHKSFEFTYTIVPMYEGNEMIPREFVIDIFSSNGYAKHIVLSNGVPGKTVNYSTGEIR